MRVMRRRLRSERKVDLLFRCRTQSRCSRRKYVVRLGAATASATRSCGMNVGRALASAGIKFGRGDPGGPVDVPDAFWFPKGGLRQRRIASFQGFA